MRIFNKSNIPFKKEFSHQCASNCTSTTLTRKREIKDKSDPQRTHTHFDSLFKGDSPPQCYQSRNAPGNSENFSHIWTMTEKVRARVSQDHLGPALEIFGKVGN